MGSFGATIWGIIDNPEFPAWRPFKEAFLEEKLTWEMLRNTKLSGLVHATWLIYRFDIDPETEQLPAELYRIDAMIEYLQNL